MSVESIAGNQLRGLERKWKILISVMFGIFMIILDATVVNVAFTTLRREFGATLADAQWVLSIYVLSLGVTTPVSGYLADQFGIKRVYLFGLAVFVIGSFLCGLAPSLGWLIAARALQGFGGGVAQPLGPAQLYRAFPHKEQGTALGYFGIDLVFAPALGPNLGGWLRVTCKNICLDHQRRARRITWVEYRAWRDDRCVVATPDLLTEQADTCAGWLRQLAALPPDQRRALRWAAAEADGPTIARRLGRSPGAVKLLLWRGRQTMRAVGWE